MKRIYFLTTLLICMLNSITAYNTTSYQKDITDPIAAEIDSVGIMARRDFIAGNYQDAYDKWERLITDVAPQRSTADSTYADLLTMKARCQNKLKKRTEAIATIKQAICIWEEHCDTTAQFYAIMLDNLSAYLESGNNSKEAIIAGKKALAVYNGLLKNDYDKAVILIHLAESSNELGLYADAIRYELQGLSILKSEFGEHSDNYIDELQYLAKYYRNAKQDKKADNTEDRIEKLQQEANEGHGDIPEPFDFSDTKACAAHIKDARRCAEYYLSHLVNAPDMEDARAYFMGWGSGYDNVTILIGDEESKMIGNKADLFCMIAYYAGCVKYAIDNKASKFSRDMFRSAVIDMINFYRANDMIFDGKQRIAYIEKYIKAYEKDGMNGLLKIADKVYDKIKKQAENQGLADKLDGE